MRIAGNDVEVVGNRITVGRPQVSEGHTPRLAKGRRATGKWHRRKASDSFESAEIGDEKLSTPEPAIGAVTDTIERHPHDPVRHLMLGEAGGDVGVMVLHAEGLDPIEGLAISSASAEPVGRGNVKRLPGAMDGRCMEAVNSRIE